MHAHGNTIALSHSYRAVAQLDNGACSAKLKLRDVHEFGDNPMHAHMHTFELCAFEISSSGAQMDPCQNPMHACSEFCFCYNYVANPSFMLRDVHEK